LLTNLLIKKCDDSLIQAKIKKYYKKPPKEKPICLSLYSFIMKNYTKINKNENKTMIKTLKLFTNAIKRNNNPKLHTLFSPSMIDIIKFNSTTIFYVPFFLSLVFFIEIIIFPKWSSYLILTCSLVILLLFIGFRLIMHLFKTKDQSLSVLFYLFLSLSSSLLISSLISKLIGFELPSSQNEFNNEKTSLLFMSMVMNSFYAYLFSLIKLGSYRLALTLFHKIILILAILITIKLDAYYYFQNIVFELLSISLLILSTRPPLNKPSPETPRPTELKKKVSNHNEWKAMVNEFPIGVVILSHDKKVMFSNKTVQDMFDLQVNKPSISRLPEKEKEEKQVSLNFLKESPINNGITQAETKIKESKGMKVSFEELNIKIGKLEEVEDQKNENISSPVERSHSYSSSNELTILSHKSKTLIKKPPPFLYHYNSVNPNYQATNNLSNNNNNNNNNNSPRSRSHNSKNSYSILSSMRIQEKERENNLKQNIVHKSSCAKNFKEDGGRKYQTEKVIKFKDEEKTKFAKTKIVKIKNKDCDLDQIIMESIKKNKSNMKLEYTKTDTVLQGVKTYCTQFKNFKKSDNIKKKYQLKIQMISYKQQESFLILIEDVTYMDSIAHLRENNEYKNKIMTTLSHEIRTPLNGAIPALEEIVSTLEDDNLRNSLMYPLKSLYLLSNVLGDAVDFALINSNQLYLNYDECNIFEFLKETVEIFSLQADLKNIDLSFNFFEDKLPPKKVIADFQRIRQILVSLIGNSMKNTREEGSINITIEVGPELCPISPTKLIKTKEKSPDFPDFRKVFSIDSDNEKQEKIAMKFAVTDTGFGIDPFKLVIIRQCLKEKNPLEACNNLNHETGCGLGLTISHCLALILGPKNNNGLKIESIMDNGTTTEFCIEFYVERKPYQDFVNALSTIRETKEITKYSTKKRVGAAGVTRLLTNNSKTSKASKVSKISKNQSSRIFTVKSNKILRSTSCDLTILNKINKPILIKNKKWVSEDTSPIPSNRGIKELKEIELTIGSIGKESVHISQYQRNHQFNTINFENLFISPPKNGETKKSPEKLFNNCSSKSTYSHHFDELLRNTCVCEEALIVDDDAFNLKSLEMLLGKFQKRCVKAYNGEEAIKIIQEKYSHGLCGERCKGFRIIFMDYHMPIKNGVETTKFLKGMMDLHELPIIPIIACTAFGAKDLVEEWEKAGMTHFMTKPITAKKIEAILEKWI